jgi:large subunit ribosomal protein L35
MPKMKSNRGARKRFRISASGHLKRKKAFHSHILTKKSQHRKRNMRKPGEVAVSDRARVRRMLVE